MKSCKAQYELSKAHFESSQEAADEVKAKIESIEHVAEALFDEWRDEIEQYTNNSLKRQSQLQLKTTEVRYRSVIKAMHRTEEKNVPGISSVKRQYAVFKA